jgi:thiamine-monophosphate kinase
LNKPHHQAVQHPDEFSLIKRYFQRKAKQRPDVMMGIGDDAAILKIPQGELLAAAIDTMVAGVHFPEKTSPFDIGYKALAVNLSDLAAMGAAPAWLTLALTMPQSDSDWLQAFADGLFLLANKFDMQLVGGDTTRGPLTISIQAHGFVKPDDIIYRHGAKAGDQVYVSGTLGDAGLGLLAVTQQKQLHDHDKNFILQRLNRPQPRVELGMALRGIASSAIDVSDGLIADLRHILDASQVGAVIHAENLPLSSALKNNLTNEEAVKLALTSGDDYELCFTIPKSREQEFLSKINSLSVPCTRIGDIISQPELQVNGYHGEISTTGYQHFAK